MSDIIVTADVPTLRLRTNAIVQSTDYEDLENLPKINSVELKGNKSLANLGIQPALVSGTNIKTINNESILTSGNINIPSKTSDLTNDSGFIDNTVSDLVNYVSNTTHNADIAELEDAIEEVEAEIPDVIDNVSSTSTADALSANMGKELQSQISNLQNIGRFLAIWDCTTGLPTSEPTSLPYTYRTGDYYRVGQVGTTNYMPNGASYTGTASTTVCTDSPSVGAVFYYDSSVWRMQASGGGGTVQDVQVNGTSVLVGGIANIPIATTSADGAMSSTDKVKLNGIENGAQVNAPNTVIDANYVHTDNNYTTAEKTKLTNIEAGAQVNPTDYLAYSEQSLTDEQKAQARANTDSFTMEEYNSSATSYAEGVIYYTTEA